MTNNIDAMSAQTMSKDELIKSYIELSKEKDLIEMQQDIIKSVIKEKMTAENLNKFSNQYGSISIESQKRRNFQQEVAKKFLTEEQLQECYKEIDVNFVKIISAEAKANMRF